MEYEIGDVVYCTVINIVGTTVFLKIEDHKDLEGSMITSEIAPGRIRNLRDYVVPNKKVVCKIIRISGNHIDLSLRRVSEKERKEVLERNQKERNSKNIIMTISREKGKDIIKKIKNKFPSLVDFLQKAKENPAALNEFFNGDEVEKLIKIINEKKEKQIQVKKEFFLTCKSSDGALKIRSTLENTDAKYLGSSKFRINLTGENFKQANLNLKKLIGEIEEKAKRNRCEFSIKEK